MVTPVIVIYSIEDDNLNKLENEIMYNEYSHRQHKTFVKKNTILILIIKNFFKTLFSFLETIQ